VTQNGQKLDSDGEKEKQKEKEKEKEKMEKKEKTLKRGRNHSVMEGIEVEGIE
jgi:hypothetical protein